MLVVGLDNFKSNHDTGHGDMFVPRVGNMSLGL